jgi:choline monooxygenase
MQPAFDIFDPSHYEAVRRPVDEAGHLPAWCYTSEAFYRREVETIFRKEWIFLGRADDCSKPGDYLTVEHTGVPLIIMRGRRGELRAFANTCRHRGAQLLSGAGTCKSHIVCPYHSWTFDIDGRLAAAPGMNGIKNFDRKDYNLVPVRLETWGGFVFINFDSDSPPLSSYLGELPELLESYNLSEMVCTKQKHYSVAANWKLAIENALEDYHTATVHRRSVGAQTLDILSGQGNWTAGFFPGSKSIGTLPGETKVLPWLSTLNERTKSGTHFVLIYPAGKFTCMQDGIFWGQLYPRGPSRTDVVMNFAYPQTTIARPDFGSIVERYYHRCDTSIPEDNNIVEVQQRGLSSPLAAPGRVSLREPVVNRFANWILDHVVPDQGKTVSASRRSHAA